MPAQRSGATDPDTTSNLRCKESTRQHSVDNPRQSVPAAMPGVPFYSDPFSPLPGRRFRLVAHPGEAGPPHRPEPVAWRGSWRHRTAAAIGSRPAKAAGCQQTRAADPPPWLATRRPAGRPLQVDPAALPIHLIDLALAEAPPNRGVSLCATQALGLIKVTTRTADPKSDPEWFSTELLPVAGYVICGDGEDLSSNNRS
jgi:hypothetical protein